MRLPGPATLDPDEHAAVVYLDRLVAAERLEEPLLSSPKPLLTVVHGLAWRLGHDWRLLEALAVAAFALAVVCLARAAGRLGGLPAAAATVLAVGGSGPLVLQTARGNSMVFALAGWSVALDALTRGRRAGSVRVPARAPWGLAAAALAVAGLARAETWLLLPLAAGYGLLAWRRGERRALLLVLPLAAPLLWLVHDWLLTGDPLYTVGVPGRYTDLVSGRQVIPPVDWLTLVAGATPPTRCCFVLAVAGAVWLVRRHAWIWLAALGVTGFGVLALLGLEAWRGTYVSWRYFDPADVALRLTAALGAAALATWVAGRLAGRSRPDGLAAGVGPALLIGAACWPLAPADPLVGSTLDRDTRLSANTAAAIAVLRPVAAGPDTVITVSGPQRVRVAVELELPLGRVRDLFLAGRAAPLDRAPGSAACSTTPTATVPPSGSPPSRPPSRRGSGRSSWSPCEPTPPEGCSSTGSRGREGDIPGCDSEPFSCGASNIFLNDCSGGETRTRNLSVNSRLLCRLSYPGMAASLSSARTRPMTARWVVLQL